MWVRQVEFAKALHGFLGQQIALAVLIVGGIIRAGDIGRGVEEGLENDAYADPFGLPRGHRGQVPAASRPSKITTTFRPLKRTHSCSFTSSTCRRPSSFSKAFLSIRMQFSVAFEAATEFDFAVDVALTPSVFFDSLALSIPALCFLF